MCIPKSLLHRLHATAVDEHQLMRGEYMLESRKPRDYKDQFCACCQFGYYMIWFHLFSHQDNVYNRFAQACSLQYAHPSYCYQCAEFVV